MQPITESNVYFSNDKHKLNYLRCIEKFGYCNQNYTSTMLEELRDYYRHKMKERDNIDDRWNGGDHCFVFCHPDGKAFHQERPYLWFRNFIQKNKLRYIRFHDLRHTSATLLINQGVHAKIISERLGHGNINTTMNVYGHVLRSADQSAADKFETILTRKQGQK